MMSKDNREFWDSQYRFSKVTPDFKNLTDEMSRRNIAFCDDHFFEQYGTGDHPRQFVEICELKQPGPVLPVFVHGGFWWALTAQEHRFVLEGLFAYSGVVGNIEYRLMPEHRFPELIADVRAGVELLWDRYKIPIWLIGHSAGAHLALSAAMEIESKKLAGVTGLSGIYDLAPMQFCFLQDELHFSQQEIQDFSVSNSTRIPECNILLSAGENETPEVYRQARFLQSKWLNKKRHCDVFIDPGSNHISILFSLATPESHIHNAMKNSIKKFIV